MKETNSLSLIRFQCILHDSAVVSSAFGNFFKLKSEDLICLGYQFCRIAELFAPPPLPPSLLVYFNLEHLKDPNYLTFIRLQCIPYDSVLLFSISQNFCKLKKREQISRREPIMQQGWTIWSRFLYFNLGHFRNQHSSLFSRFQCALLDSAKLLAVFKNFLKLKREDLTSLGVTNSAEQLNYLVIPFVFRFKTFQRAKFFLIC